MNPNRSHRPLGRVAAATVVLGMVAAACGGGSDDADDGATTAQTDAPADSAQPDDGEAGGDTTLVTFIGPEAPESMAPVIAAFEEQNPDIDVEYEAVPFADLNSIIQTRVGAGDSDPDVFTVDAPRTEAFVDRGLLAGLTGNVTDPAGIIQDSAIEFSTVDGELYALPVSTSTQILYYNADLLEAAGLPIPTMDPAERMTWEELRENAIAAQDAGAEFGFMWDQVNRYYQLQTLVESAGGGSGVGPEPLDIDITNDGWVKAMEFYGGIFEDGIGPRGVTVEQSPDVFANGQVAYWLGGPWWLPKMDGTDGLNFGIAPHPYFDGGAEVTPTGAWSWGVSANSDVSEEAIKFIEFAALDPDGALATAQGFPLPPANNETFESYYSQSQLVPGVEDLISFEIDNTAVLRPRTKGYVEFEEFMGQAFEDIRNGSDPAEALASAQELIEQAWSRLD